MTDVTNYGGLRCKEIKTNLIEGATDTGKNVGYRRAINLVANDNSGNNPLNVRLNLSTGALEKNELRFDSATKIRNIESNGNNSLVPKSTVDNFINTEFTLYPTRLVYPWHMPNFNSAGITSTTFTAKVDSGVIYPFKDSSVDGWKNAFVVNKPIPTTAGTKVYVEYDIIYPGDNLSGTVHNDLLPIIVGIMNHQHWNATTFNSTSWARLILPNVADGGGNVTCTSNPPLMFQQRGGPLGNTRVQTVMANYIDGSTNSGDWVRSGLKIQVGYDLDADDLEITMFDGPEGNGSAHGKRMYENFTDITNNTFNAAVDTFFYISVETTGSGSGDYPYANAPKVALAKNKMGYYVGAKTGMVELT